MAKKTTSLLSQHKISKGEQVPLHVTNKMLRALDAPLKSETLKTYEKLPLDEKIKSARGKNKPKRVV